MIKRDIAPLNRFLVKVKDASKLGLKEVRIDTKDAVEISTLLAQILLDQQQDTVIRTTGMPENSLTDGGRFRS